MPPRKKSSGAQRRRTAAPVSQPGSVPGRAADQPFCAYLGAQGETCAETSMLETVFVIEGPPRMVLLACPAHRESVRQMAAAFVLRTYECPQTVAFRYRDQIYHLRVSSIPDKPVC